jgi:activator of HSP90 ATPase
MMCLLSLDDDFTKESDLHMACMILQRQIERIDGKRENIVIPGIRMKQIREMNSKKEVTLPCHFHDGIVVLDQQANGTATNSSVNVSSNANSAPAESTAAETKTDTSKAKHDATHSNETKSTAGSQLAAKENTEISSDRLCVLCLSEERRLACLPCSHLAICVPCGHSLRSCPICRRKISASVRISV